MNFHHPIPVFPFLSFLQVAQFTGPLALNKLQMDKTFDDHGVEKKEFRMPKDSCANTGTRDILVTHTTSLKKQILQLVNVDYLFLTSGEVLIMWPAEQSKPECFQSVYAPAGSLGRLCR